MNALRRELPGFIPGHEHDEGVARRRRQGAIRLLLSIHAAKDIRPSIDRQIERAAPKTIHLTPFWIQPSEVRLERTASLAKRINRPLGELTLEARAEHWFDGQ